MKPGAARGRFTADVRLTQAAALGVWGESRPYNSIESCAFDSLIIRVTTAMSSTGDMCRLRKSSKNLSNEIEKERKSLWLFRSFSIQHTYCLSSLCWAEPSLSLKNNTQPPLHILQQQKCAGQEQGGAMAGY